MSSRLLLIKSPFLLVRFVLFSLLIYANLTALVFAAWNSLLHPDFDRLFMLLLKPGPETTAASIITTMSGPPEFCEMKAPLSICASTTILVPISWLAATLSISTLCITHLRLYPAVWLTSIYNIAWFTGEAGDRRNSTSHLRYALSTPDPIHLFIPSRRHSTSSVPRDVENQVPVGPNHEKSLPSPGSSNFWWGRLLPGRAGRDHPFGFRRARGPEYQWWENGGNEDQGAGEETLHKYPPFPPVTEVLNEDEPIPLGERSQWVCAAQAPGPYTPRFRSATKR
ncbi:hypothetical protein B0F90DRAFT_1665802 [Multifurca ochricompacta]|uniref:Uncharacterized protein n=1 Tax=Multifurca ochricompacta TaxID=376703 RepID=A0AAD4MC97_9AGAM|nr:hypothetical protein B0F90DRAFT_1665802 [Multifurca ochricompacta]